MKRYAALVLLLVTSTVVVFGADIPRHVDPALVSADDPKPVPLFDLYLGIYQAIGGSNYDQALQLLDFVDSVPASQATRESLDSYNEVIRTVVENLKESEFNIEEAYGYLSWLKDADADSSLDSAVPFLESAGLSVEILDDQSIAIARDLDGSPTILLEGTGEVSEFIEYLSLLVGQGYLDADTIRAARLVGLEDTVLELGVNNTNPWVGSSVTITGSLGTANTSLGAKNLELRLDNQLVSQVLTDESGLFTYIINLPYRYVEDMQVSATYRPTIEDVDHYTPVRDSERLYPQYYVPELTLNNPESVYPGKPYEISGSIKHESIPLSGFTLKLEAFHQTFTLTSDSHGAFSTKVSIFNSESSGKQSVTLRSEAYQEYAPTALTQQSSVKRIKTNLNIDNSRVLVSTNTAILSGIVEPSDGSFAHFAVDVRLGDKQVTSFTDDSGRFSAEIPRSLFSFSSWNTYSISVRPIEPWVQSLTVRDSILVVGILPLVASPLLLVGLILNLRRPKTATGLPDLVTLIPAPIVVEYPRLPGLAGVYARAVEFVHRVTRLSLAPNNTLREYLENVRPVLVKPVYRLFRKLSQIYEQWLYGPRKSMAPVKVSENLLRKMEEENAEN